MTSCASVSAVLNEEAVPGNAKRADDVGFFNYLSLFLRKTRKVLRKLTNSESELDDSKNIKKNFYIFFVFFFVFFCLKTNVFFNCIFWKILKEYSPVSRYVVLDISLYSPPFAFPILV